jgi:type IV secretion system protein TrbL
MAAGSSGGHGLLLDPSRIAGYGLNATEALAKALEKVSITDIGDALVFGISYLIIMAAFLVMAIQAFIAVLEYYLIAAIAGVLVPWALLPQTKFLAEKAIGAVVSAGIKLMVLAFIIAVADPVLSSIRFSGEEIKLNELWSVLLVSSAIAYLAWQAPSLAAGLLAGSPSLGASGIAQNVTASVMLAAGVVGGVVAATRAAAGVAAAAAGRVGRAGGLTSHSEANSGGESAGSGSGPPATGGPVGPPPGAGGPGRPGPAQGALSAGASPGRAGSAAPAADASNVAKELATGFQATKSDPGRRMSLDAPPPAPAPANASASPPAWAASARADLAASAPGTAKPRSATRSVHREGGRVKG